MIYNKSLHHGRFKWRIGFPRREFHDSEKIIGFECVIVLSEV